MKSYKINVDEEFMQVLEKLKEKIKLATWDGIENLSYRTLTKVLARKIISSKIV